MTKSQKCHFKYINMAQMLYFSLTKFLGTENVNNFSSWVSPYLLFLLWTYQIGIH